MAQATRVYGGIPQASPISPFLYLFYNTNLQQFTRDQVSTSRYIDNASLSRVGSTVLHNTNPLQVAQQKAED
jgi:hypothetical protein